MPAFGSCAGMILLADRVEDAIAGQETLGGIDMTVRRNAFGRQVDSFESDIALAGVPGPDFRAVFIRAPWVEETGPGVEIIGTESRTGRIVAVRQGPALATAFHPELTPDLRIHKLFHRHGKGTIMSGHSKWATTKHKKAVVDARRGKLFAKLIKNVEVAAQDRRRRPGRATPRCTTPSRRPRRTRCRTRTSTGPSAAAPGSRRAAPPTRPSPTRGTPPAGWRCWSSA